MKKLRQDFNAQKAIAQGKSAIASGVNTAKKKLGMQPPAPPSPPPPPPKPKKRAMVGAAIKKVGAGVGKVGGGIGRGIASGGKAIGQELKARSIAKRATAADEGFVKHATEFQAQKSAQRKASTGFRRAKQTALKGKLIASTTPDMEDAGEARRHAKAQAKIHKNAMKSIKQKNLIEARRSLRGDSSLLLREDGPRDKVGGRCGKGWQDGPSGKCIRAGKSGLGYGQVGKGVGGKAKWLGKHALMGTGDVEYNRRRSLGQGRVKSALHGYASGVKGGAQNILLGGGAGGAVYRRSRAAGQGRLRAGAKGLGTNVAVNAALGAAVLGVSNALQKKQKSREEVIQGELINPSSDGGAKTLTGSSATKLLPGSSPQPKQRSATIAMKPRPEAAAGREALNRIAVKKLLEKSSEAAAKSKPPAKPRRKGKKRGDSSLGGMRWKPRTDSIEERHDAPRRKVNGKCGKGWTEGSGDKCVRAKGKFSVTYGQRGKGVKGTAKWIAKNAVLGSGDVEYNRRRSLGQDREEAFVHGYASGVKGGVQDLALGPIGGSVYRRSRDKGQGRLKAGAKGVGSALFPEVPIGVAAVKRLSRE